MSCQMKAVLWVVALVAVAAVATAADQQTCYDLETTILGRSGITFGSGTYGLLLDVNKQPIVRLLANKTYEKPLGADKVPKRAAGRFDSKARLADVYSIAPDFPSFQEVSWCVNGNHWWQQCWQYC